jgi:hypothetical protein
MTESEEGKERGFTVVDRRASARASDTPVEPDGSDPAAAEAESPAEARFDFSLLVQSFAITALHHLGQMPDPAGARGEPNLPLARQNVEILEILEQKTRGNLEPGEAHLLASLLYEVRMHYVEASKSRR